MIRSQPLLQSYIQRIGEKHLIECAVTLIRIGGGGYMNDNMKHGGVKRLVTCK